MLFRTRDQITEPSFSLSLLLFCLLLAEVVTAKEVNRVARNIPHPTSSTSLTQPLVAVQSEASGTTTSASVRTGYRIQSSTRPAVLQNGVPAICTSAKAPTSFGFHNSLKPTYPPLQSSGTQTVVAGAASPATTSGLLGVDITQIPSDTEIKNSGLPLSTSTSSGLMEEKPLTESGSTSLSPLISSPGITDGSWQLGEQPTSSPTSTFTFPSPDDESPGPSSVESNFFATPIIVPTDSSVGEFTESTLVSSSAGEVVAVDAESASSQINSIISLPSAPSPSPPIGVAHTESSAPVVPPIAPRPSGEEPSATSTAGIWALATAIVSVAESSKAASADTQACLSQDCLGPGGGCIVFSTLLPICGESNDDCICDLSFAAQVCAQCVSAQEAVETYNTYLNACSARGLITPTQTIGVVTESETQSAMSDGSGAQGNESGDGIVAVITSTLTSGGASSITGSPSGDVTLTYPSSILVSTASIDKLAALEKLGVAHALDTGSTSNAETNPDSIDVESTLTSSVAHPGSTGGASLSETGVLPYSTTGALSETAGKPLGETLTTAALDKSHAFFAEAIDPSCESDCEGWLQLASSCTDDSCVCATEALTSASACSSCIGSTSQGESNKAQMSAYSGFVSACRSQPATAAGAAVGASGGLAALAPTPIDSVSGSRTGSMTRMGSPNPFITDEPTGKRKTVTAEEANGIRTVTAGSGALSLRPSKMYGFEGGLTLSMFVVGLISGMIVV